MPRQVISFQHDRTQAHSPTSTTGPSSAIFGGLHDQENSYAWSGALEESDCSRKCGLEWIVDLSIAFIGADGEHEFTTQRVLVDTGCSDFKLREALGQEMSERWGFAVKNDECPSRSELAGLRVRFVVAGHVIDVDAMDLFLNDGESPRQCNRIRQHNADSMRGHDVVFGNALLAGLSSVAFDYERRRIGFPPRSTA
jgi:hypothetical protein